MPVTVSSAPPASSEPSSPALGDKLAYLGFLLGMGFLCVQLGMLFAAADSPLYHVTRDGLLAAQALLAERSMQGEKYPHCLWYETRHRDKGLIRSVPERIAPGYTLYSSGHESAVIAVDESGKEVRRWTAPFSRVFPSAPHLPRPVPDNAIYIRRFHPYENGDMLVQYETPTTSPNGRGLAKITLEGQVLWTYNDCTHHDLNVGDDGRIYTLTQTIRSDAHSAFAYLGGPQIEEFVAILSPEGKELVKFSLFDLLGESPYLRKIVTRTDSHGDILHSNTISLIGEQFAACYPEIDAGDLMVCLRNLNLVIVINPERKQIVWATSGPWHFPHDPTPMDDGTILIFDNCFTWGTEVRSRVLQFDPRESRITWSFSAGEGSPPLLSHIRSCQQRLPNGNTLINESDHGRLLEVTPEGEVVWEYVNPIRGGRDDSLIPVVSGAARYTADRLPFLKEASPPTQSISLRN